jgi:hypothetical protein
MDVLHIPAVAIFTGMISAFTIILLCVTVSDAIRH